MQPCNRIYYSNVYWRLNMFRAAHRSSSGALNCIRTLWFTYTCGDRQLLSPHSALTAAGHHMCIETRGCKHSLELLMMSAMALETCWAFNKRWNNKFYYKVASCWLFLLIWIFNPLKRELNHICYLLALLGAHHFLHVSRIRVKSLTFRRLMSHIYGAPILDVSRSHTTTQHSR